MTLGQRLQNRENNFDAIRLVAALLVLVSHSFYLTGRSFEPWQQITQFDTLGGLAVGIFFIISGFLVTASYQSDPNPGQWLGVGVNLSLFIGTATLFTLLAAVGSWYLVERPALSLRHRLRRAVVKA